MKSIWVTPSNAEFYSTLKEDAAEGETNWTVSKNTKRGDTMLLYICAPVSAIVAAATVSTDAEKDEDPSSIFFGRYFSDMHGLFLFDNPITREQLMKACPDWGYLKQPRNCVRVPAEHEEFLRALMAIKGFGYEAYVGNKTSGTQHKQSQ